MKTYSDAALREMINAGKEATREMRLLKTKEATRLTSLLSLRRNEMSQIRLRATELGLTQADLDEIHRYVHERND